MMPAFGFGGEEKQIEDGLKALAARIARS